MNAPIPVRVAAAATLVAALGTAFLGCRGAAPTLDENPELSALRSKAKPAAAATRLALSPVEIAYAPSADLDKDSSRYPAKVDRDDLDQGLRRAIATYTSFGEPVPAGGEAGRGGSGADLASPAAEAAAAGAEVLVRPRLDRLECVWRGRNWRWLPNVLLWIQFWVPSFWVADENFAVEGELEVLFQSVASERSLYAKRVPISAEWPLDDFERGWSLTGIVTAPKTVDVDDWGTVSESLAPLVHYEVEKGAVTEIAGGLADYLGTADFAAKDATVYALVCGLSRHAAGVAGPRGAAADAERAAALLRERARVPAKNIRTLADQRATADAVERGIVEFLGKTRPRDTALLYWSGLGTTCGGVDQAAPGGGKSGLARRERCLLPYDVDPGAIARTALPLGRLRDLLAKVPAGRVLVVLDASFGGGRPGTRSLFRGGEAEVPPGEADLERFADARDGKEVTLLVASGPDEDAIDLDEASRGLLSYLFEEGAAGAADEDGSGAVSAGELQAFLEREVSAQAGVDGVEQCPRLYRAGHRRIALDPTGRGPWLPNADLAVTTRSIP